MIIRLDKFLADMSVGTRSEVKKFLKAGRIRADGVVIKDGSLKIQTENSCISFDGQQVQYQEYEYYMLYKPADVITAVSDSKEKTVLDLISSARKDLFPVGRLDKDTVGLLLITNNGTLAHNMLAPKKHVDKTYYARLDGMLTEEMCRTVEDGVYIEKGIKSQPAVLRVEENTPEGAGVYLTIHEGRFHQVKKMFEAVGRRVTYLKRVSFGPLVLDETLHAGEYRMLNEKELNLLKSYMD